MATTQPPPPLLQTLQISHAGYIHNSRGKSVSYVLQPGVWVTPYILNTTYNSTLSLRHGASAQTAWLQGIAEEIVFRCFCRVKCISGGEFFHSIVGVCVGASANKTAARHWLVVSQWRWRMFALDYSVIIASRWDLCVRLNKCIWSLCAFVLLLTADFIVVTLQRSCTPVMRDK